MLCPTGIAESNVDQTGLRDVADSGQIFVDVTDVGTH
jgi:hypothetical protein